MRIWHRTGLPTLTHSRHVFGMPISYDGLTRALQECGIDCVQEYPDGNAFSDPEQIVPPDRQERLELWWASPAYWDVTDVMETRGVVGNAQLGESYYDHNGLPNIAKCDVLFCGSMSGAEFHSTYQHVPVYFLTGGVEPGLFPYIERNFNATPFVFLHAGCADFRKGTDIACHAFLSAFPTETDVELLILSPGLTPAMVDLASRYDGESRIKFVSKVVEQRELMAQEYYAQGHCLVYPSLVEGWGRCLAEAMLTGMPCIVARASSMLDQFSSDCGWWVETRQAENGAHRVPEFDSLTRAMQSAYTDRIVCAYKGAAARRFSFLYNTWEVGIGRVLPVLNRVYQTQRLADVAGGLDYPVKLNIGSGGFTIDGWVNIDKFAGRHNASGRCVGVYRHDVSRPFPLPDHSVSAVAVSFIGSDIGESEWDMLLSESRRMLESGGIIRVTDDDCTVSTFPSRWPSTANTMCQKMARFGLDARPVPGDDTLCVDPLIMTRSHGEHPEAYFCEGVK